MPVSFSRAAAMRFSGEGPGAEPEAQRVLHDPLEVQVLDQRVLAVNRRFAELFGVPADRVTGQHLEDMRTLYDQVFDEAADLYEASVATSASTCVTPTVPIWLPGLVRVGARLAIATVQEKMAVSLPPRPSPTATVTLQIPATVGVPLMRPLLASIARPIASIR